MTAYGLLASLAWCAVAWDAVRRADRAGHREPLQESTGKDETIPSKRLPEKAEIPDDLVALANTESEEWAREDVLQDLRLKYSVLNDWQRVRRAVGIGELP